MNFEGLKFELTRVAARDRVAPATTASLLISINGEPVWPVDGEALGFDIQVDDLLSYLTEYWKPLILRQTYPIAVSVDRPSLFRSAAESRWEDQPFALVEREDETVCNFEDAHNLARCFAGFFDLPSFWLLRANDHFIIDTQRKVHLLSFEQVYVELSRVGDEIASHLSSGSRWGKLVELWQGRDYGNPVSLLAWATSLDKETAEKFTTEKILSAPKSVAEAAQDTDELKIAARMASALPADQIEQILTLVRSFEHRDAQTLGDLSARVSTYVSEKFQNHRAHEQGEAAADFVRRYLEVSASDYVDIFDVVRKLGAGLYQQPAEPTNLDALAVWGNKFGPAVLLNSNSLRASSRYGDRNWAARVTLAHELCHLLIDRGHALSAVEVLNSRMPLTIERRARAFAGELLLPSMAAVEVWEAAQAPKSREGLFEVIKSLRVQFGVTTSVASWKLDHGLKRRDVDLSVLLDAIAPFR